MTLWWLEPDRTKAVCANCGCTIWPEGDPDHGVCYDCFMQNAQQEQPPEEQQLYEDGQ
jgi:hypothetical protein